ncbi:hypothetical protein DFH06DRAFT_1347567 [Mycena polygramma]|nr:hypothetical protein DFH06DRAFT_1347567 [Mycena polygramma]
MTLPAQMAPIWCRPDAQFFDAEQTHDATGLIGSYDLRTRGVVGQHGHRVYTQGRDERTLRACEPDITRYELRLLPGATARAVTAFKNDVSVLVSAMIEEACPDTMILGTWAEDTGEGKIHFCHHNFTTTINGMPDVGQCVVVDVSLHRIDTVMHGMKCKSYSLIAHTTEIVHPARLRAAGVIMESLATSMEETQVADTEALDVIMEEP